MSEGPFIACTASLILVRLERALNEKEVAEETLEELMPALLQGNLNFNFFLTLLWKWIHFSEKEKQSEIEQWLVEESVSCSSDPAQLPSIIIQLNLCTPCSLAFIM